MRTELSRKIAERKDAVILAEQGTRTHCHKFFSLFSLSVSRDCFSRNKFFSDKYQCPFFFFHDIDPCWMKKSKKKTCRDAWIGCLAHLCAVSHDE